MEDLQERYRDKRGELKPKSVPLAADAAHLLTEYLDQFCIELVRAGMTEPYRTTREYEEIFVQELQQKSSTTKLTYDVTSSVLEKYGTPKQLAEYHIKNNDEDVIVMNTEDNNSSTFVQLIFGTLLVYVVSIQLVGAINLPLVINEYDFSLFYITAAVIFVLIEAITGLSGKTILTRKYYNQFRETVRFLSTVLVLGATMGLLDNLSLASRASYQSYITWWTFFIIWLSFYGTGIIKDHTNLMQSTVQAEKPIARFLLPSYILLVVAYVIGSVSLLFNYDLPPVFNSSVILMRISLIIAVASLAADIRRRYPQSIKKIGYTTVLIFYLPLLVYSYTIPDEYYPGYYGIEFQWSSILLNIVVFGLLAGLAVIGIFRMEIREQLDRYQLQLEEYRS